MAFILITLSVVVAYYASYLFYSAAEAKLAPGDQWARLVLGVAMVAVLMYDVLHAIPGTSSSLLIFALLLCVVIGGKPILRAATPSAPSAAITALLLLFVIWRLWPAALTANLVPLEGTGNHDEHWYLATANWLIDHSLRAPFVNNALYPYVSAAATHIGALPRIGAEGVLVYMAVIASLDLPAAFQASIMLSAVLLVAATVCNVELISSPVSSNSAENIRRLISIFLAAASPVYLLIYANMNFSTLFGLSFLGVYYYYFSQLFQCAGVVSNRLCAVCGLLLAALATTYPELIPVAAVASFGYGFTNRRAIRFNRMLRSALMVSLSTFVFSPMAWIKLGAVGATISSAVVQAPTGGSPLISTLKSSAAVLHIMTMKADLVQARSPFLAIIGSALFVWLLVSAPKKAISHTCGLLIATSMVMSYVIWRDYDYGVFKSIEFISLPLTILTCTSISNSLVGRRKILLSKGREGRWQFYAASLMQFLSVGGGALWIGATLIGTLQFFKNAHDAEFTRALKQLNEVKHKIYNNSLIYVSDELGSQAFTKSRWIAYIFKDTPLIFAPALRGGGYIYGLDGADQGGYESIGYLLRKFNYNLRDENGKGKNVIFSNGDYEVLGPPFVLPGDGFHADEGGWRWMAGAGNLNLVGECVKNIKFHIKDHFGGGAGRNYLDVLEGGRDTRFVADPGSDINYEIKFPDTKRIILKAAGPATSPYTLGLSGDQRQLTFAIQDIVALGHHSCK